MSGNEFLEIHKTQMEPTGFWSEEYRSSIIGCIEAKFKTEVIREWTITDFVSNGDRVLVKWVKRLFPLTDKELSEKYGR